MSAHTQDHYRAAIKALADERKDCKSDAPIGPKLVEALRTITACLSSMHFDDKGKQIEARNALTIARAALAEWDAQP